MSVTINGTNGLTFNDASTQTTAATGFGFKNRIINGAMVIDQRNAGASVSVSDGQDKYPVDRFYVSNRSGSAVVSAQQTAASVPATFKNSLIVTTTTANASLSSTQYAALRHSIEGFNVSDLGWGTASAQTITISFWVRSSLTGTFGGSLLNAGFNRSYPFSYTISAANTWEQKTVTIAGDTSGTWATDNTAGIHLFFGLGAGSSVSGTAGSWSGTFYYSATGATSVVGTNGATFYITGVQLEKGSTATSFDYRPYGTELALCQRYFEVMNGQIDTGANGSGTAYATWFFKQEKRATPTITQTGLTIAGQNAIGVGAAQWYSTSSNPIRISTATASSEL
jgi:hypothetical protein